MIRGGFVVDTIRENNIFYHNPPLLSPPKGERRKTRHQAVPAIYKFIQAIIGFLSIPLTIIFS
jgi:hypothetical protein